MTIGYRLLLANIQGVTARMFTTTLRSQPVYSRSRPSELLTFESPAGSTIWTGDRDATFSRWFSSLIGAPTYLYDATFHSFFFYAHAKWKAQIYCDSWTSTRIEILGREGSVSPMCGCTLCLGLPYKNSGLRRCSTRQPTMYSYTASHRSPCIRVDSPT